MAEENKRIQLKNVRLSFPSLFSRSVFDGKEGKFEATFLIPKSDKKTKTKIDTLIEDAIAAAKIKVPQDKRCLKDGDVADYDGYEECWSLKASANARPNIINRDRSQLSEDDGVLYAGCYVNAIIDVWVQNNSWGKRVNANLYGIQFLKDGEAFGRGSVNVVDEFDDIDDDDDDDDDL